MGSAIVIVGVNDASEGLPYNDGTDKYAGSPDANPGGSPTDESDLWTNDGNYADEFAGGSGQEDDPYLISTPEQLARLAYLIDSTTSSSYRYLHYKQTADIDLDGYYWLPIGLFDSSSSYCFSGFYDGGGYKITNMKFKSGSYKGLFGYIDGNGIIENIKGGGQK